MTSLNFKGSIRSPLAGALCLAFLAACLWAVPRGHAAVNDDDRSREAVERQQRIAIDKFYASQNGRVPMTPMAIELYNDAVKFFEKNEHEMAREALKESLSLEARNAPALELLGEIENLQQNFEKAENYYKQAYLVSPSTRLRQKIEKLQKEHAVEKDLDTDDEEHFLIKYRKDERGYDGYELKGLLRECYRQISQDFGTYFNHKITVLFYSKDEFHSVTGQSAWVNGLYDGKIRLPSYRQGFRELDLRATVTHEMTHAFVTFLGGMNTPVWIQEGLAQYEQNKVVPVDTSILRAAVRTRSLMPLSRILSEKLQMDKMDPLEVALFYQESFMIVKYMVDRFQMYRLKEVLAKFKEGKPAEQAIEEVLGLSTLQLEKDWLATIQ